VLRDRVVVVPLREPDSGAEGAPEAKALQEALDEDEAAEVSEPPAVKEMRRFFGP